MHKRRLMAGWGDMDFDAHMKNTADLDKSADVRMMYFAENGFPSTEFVRLKIGPVIMKDEIEHYREVRLLKEMHVDIAIAGLADDGSRFMVRNSFLRLDGKPVTRVTSTGGWIDLSARKLIPAPAALLKVLLEGPRTEDFRQLPASVG